MHEGMDVYRKVCFCMCEVSLRHFDCVTSLRRLGQLHLLFTIFTIVNRHFWVALKLTPDVESGVPFKIGKTTLQGSLKRLLTKTTSYLVSWFQIIRNSEFSHTKIEVTRLSKNFTYGTLMPIDHRQNACIFDILTPKKKRIVLAFLYFFKAILWYVDRLIFNWTNKMVFE